MLNQASYHENIGPHLGPPLFSKSNTKKRNGQYQHKLRDKIRKPLGPKQNNNAVVSNKTKEYTYSLAVQKYNPPAVGKVEQISAMPKPINMTKKATNNQPQMMATGPPVAIPNPNRGTIPISTDEFVKVNPKF